MEKPITCVRERLELATEWPAETSKEEAASHNPFFISQSLRLMYMLAAALSPHRDPMTCTWRYNYSVHSTQLRDCKVQLAIYFDCPVLSKSTLPVAISHAPKRCMYGTIPMQDTHAPARCRSAYRRSRVNLAPHHSGQTNRLVRCRYTFRVVCPRGRLIDVASCVTVLNHILTVYLAKTN